MPADVTLACVGKPSAGKSSFLNAVTDASAKVGNYPFTTIEPNHGVTFYPTECPCKRFNKMEQCQPRYGKCVNGTRYVPIKMIDVAGLVPGASEGAGLGNQFLDDLRHADALIHVVDVSGTTNAKGETTVGYDPINDIDWLRSEIHSWILNNLKRKWSSTMRRHTATKSSPIDTLQGQLSGYGADHRTILRFYDLAVQRLGGKGLDEWQTDDLPAVVDAFLDVRFPTVIARFGVDGILQACNKIDLPDADKNIARLCKKYDEKMLVFTSALAECFLRKLAKGGYIEYVEGTDEITTYDDQPEDAKTLKPLDATTKARLEKVQDLVLYRYGSTGTLDTVRRIVDHLGMIPVYPVKSIHNFTSDSGAVRTGKVFRDCLLVRPGTTVKDLVEMLPGDLASHYAGAETIGAVQLSESEVITTANNIISIKQSRTDRDA